MTESLTSGPAGYEKIAEHTVNGEVRDGTP